MTHDSSTYRTWYAMHQRCGNPKHHKYHLYGAQGIAVFPAWFEFKVFCADMGHRPKGHTIDRIDGTKGYFPSNCKWSTATEQSRNRKSTKRVEYKGKLYTAGELIECFPCQVSLVALQQRLFKHKWDVDDALSMPGHARSPSSLETLRTAHNNRAKKYEYNGGYLSASKLAALPECLVDRVTLHKRLSKGWNLKIAITTPKLPNDSSRRASAKKHRV